MDILFVWCVRVPVGCCLLGYYSGQRSEVRSKRSEVRSETRNKRSERIGFVHPSLDIFSS